MDSEPSSLRTRASLLFRLRKWEDRSSWDEFYRLYRRLVYGLARRSGLNHDDAEDVTQEVFKRVAETIHEFESNPERGSFRGWLMNLTRWRVTDKFNSRPKAESARPAPSPDSADRTSTVNRIPDDAEFETNWNLEWQRHLLEAGLERIARRAKPKHFQVFELYVRQNWPVLRVSRELGVNPASVYLISHRLTKQLKEEVDGLRASLG